jgi:murein DD-endopeptidase MepM/ murein hydrolase activator NlpD
LVSVAIVLVAVPLQGARGETVEVLEQRMEEIQDDLDAATARLEELRTDEDGILVRISELDQRIEDIEEDNSVLQGRVIDRARELYMGGASGMLETLLSARDFTQLSTELEYATRVSDSDTLLFVRHSRLASELRVIRAEAEARAEELARVRSSLAETTDSLQERFRAAQDDYEALKEQLAKQAASQDTSGSTGSAPASAPAAAAPVPNLPRGSMTCPVDGPNSFIDSWGYPRSGGRTHEGTDIMTGSGTPVVAITDGNITYAGYGDSAGYWIVLSGDDGNGYWYMHNTQNLVSGGHVQVGQQIATAGNTGNASGGAPHVHFEYHPGGGGPVNPYPMLVGLC